MRQISLSKNLPLFMGKPCAALVIGGWAGCWQQQGPNGKHKKSEPVPSPLKKQTMAYYKKVMPEI